jgi:hypothetical protein
VNRLALVWVDLAVAAEEENLRLRELVLELAVALQRQRDLAGFASEQIDERFGGETA